MEMKMHDKKKQEQKESERKYTLRVYKPAHNNLRRIVHYLRARSISNLEKVGKMNYPEATEIVVNEFMENHGIELYDEGISETDSI